MAAILFSLTLFWSAFLLFLVQPLFAKLALPDLGGSPAVWNTCMVFFQTALLAGYLHAHLGPRLFGNRGHSLLHLLVLLAAIVVLPLTWPSAEAPPDRPVVFLLGRLLLSVGLPFFAVATSAPLLQCWFSVACAGRDPYFLYAASNLGSFTALLAYPFVVEPHATLAQQGLLWTVGYAALVAASLACTLLLWKSPPASVSAASTSLPWRLRLRWLGLALVPSSLLLSVTTHLTTDIAPIPLLWIAPLALYLLTFVIVFAQRPLIPAWVARRYLPIVLLALVLLWLFEATEPLWLVVTILLTGLFWLTLCCHGELARTRPSAGHLTSFYLWLALGGVLGGVLNTLVAPLVFSGLAEYPIMLVAVSLLMDSPRAGDTPQNAGKWTFLWPAAIGMLTLLWVLISPRFGWLTGEVGRVTVAALFVPPLLACFLLHERPVSFGLALGGVLLASLAYPGVHGAPLLQTRSFFGVHRVTEQDGFRQLVHGSTIHGRQSLDPAWKDEPLTYYTRRGPIGQVIASLHGDARLKRVGLIGLGTGALAAYAKPGERWTFFEIDPAVVRIARDYFSFLDSHKIEVDVLTGDGRLLLMHHPDKFGLIVIDAFGSDSIPLHLLTREAFTGYRERLAPGGLLAFHISNRYLDLEPVLANLASDAQPPWTCLVREDIELSREEKRTGKSPSIWVVMAADPRDLGRLSSSNLWRRAAPQPDLRVWTDDFSSVLSVLKRGDDR